MTLGYIDPASGSMFLQVILGGAAAVAVAFKMRWRRFLRFSTSARTKRTSDAGGRAGTPRAREEPLDPVT